MPVTAASQPQLVTLRSGDVVRIRPIKPEDARALVRAYANLGEQSRYRRFFTVLPELSEATAQLAKTAADIPLIPLIPKIPLIPLIPKIPLIPLIPLISLIPVIRRAAADLVVERSDGRLDVKRAEPLCRDFGRDHKQESQRDSSRTGGME